MSKTTMAGHEFHLTAAHIEDGVHDVHPEPIHEHYVVVRGRRYPPKQVLAAVTGLDRADFTTHQARAVLRRLGFGVYRRGRGPDAPGSSPVDGPHGGAEAALLAPYRGRWVAQVGLEILFDADDPATVLHWLRRHHRRARVWRVPLSAMEAGSALAAP